MKTNNNNNNKSTIPFKDIAMHNCFIYDGIAFVKVDSEYHNAIKLGSTGVAEFNDETIVGHVTSVDVNV